jgi:hypothetical protein
LFPTDTLGLEPVGFGGVLHHLLNVHVQLANKMGFNKKNCDRNVSTKPLPGNDYWGYTYRHAGELEGFKKYSVERGSPRYGVYTKLHKDWFRHSEFDRG